MCEVLIRNNMPIVDQNLTNEMESLLDNESDSRLDISTVDDFKPEFDNELVDSLRTNDDGDVNDPQSSDIDTDENVFYQFLRERGISDPSKIQFENEEGEIEEHSFDSLDRETQLNMLKEITNPDLSDHEMEVVEYLRKNSVTLPQVVDYFAEQRLQAYLAENPEAQHQQIYSIDDYSDDELYLADLKSKFPNFTDEELITKLETAKSNEDLYNKEVSALRDTYKEAEDQDRQNAAMREKQEYETMTRNLAQAASSFTEISLDFSDPESDSLIIEDSDRQDIMSYLLDQDSNGKSRFVKDLENPSSLIKLAYYMLKGEETISGVTQYWKETLKSERKELARLKKDLEKLSNKGNNTYVVRKESKSDTSSPNNDISSFYERLI